VRATISRIARQERRKSRSKSVQELVRSLQRAWCEALPCNHRFDGCVPDGGVVSEATTIRDTTCNFQARECTASQSPIRLAKYALQDGGRFYGSTAARTLSSTDFFAVTQWIYEFV
jgi:hypothetical protein